MKNIIPVIIALLLPVCLWGNDLSGVWHNNRAEFDTLGLALRKDGRGVLLGPVGIGILRWEQRGNDLVFRLADNNRQTEMQARYDASNDTLILQRPGKPVDILHRKSREEPPDYEAKVEQERVRQLKNVPRLVAESPEKFGTIDPAIERIRVLLAAALGEKVELTLTLSTRKPVRWLTIRTLGNSLWLDLTILTRAAPKLSPGLVGTHVPLSKAEPDLPVTYQLPGKATETLRRWLAQNMIPFEEHATEARGTWQVESYDRSLQVNFRQDQDACLRTIRQVLTQTLADTKRPYTLQILRRSN